MGSMLLINLSEKTPAEILRYLNLKLFYLYETDSTDDALVMMERMSFDVFFITLSPETEAYVWHHLNELARSHSPFTPVIMIGQNLSDRLKTTINTKGWHLFSDFTNTKGILAAVDKSLIMRNFIDNVKFTLDQKSDSHTYYTRDILTIDRIRARTIQINEYQSHSKEKITAQIFHFDAPLETFPKKYHAEHILLLARAIKIVNKVHLKDFNPQTNQLTMKNGEVIDVTAKYKKNFLWLPKPKKEEN